jgi:acetylornithine deacetylase
MRPDADDVVELTRGLVRIDSSNPDLASGGTGESAVADLVTGWLEPRGFRVQRVEEHSGRPSVLAVGNGDGRSLMLNGHLDTVGLTGYDGDPLDPVIRDGNLYGRGSYDMLSGVAAMMVAAAHAHERPHGGDIVLALVADEENASFGTEEVLRQVRTDAAVVCEPSELELTVAHKGFCWVTVTLTGRAAHGSRPDLGIDAISRAGAFLSALDTMAGQLATGPRHPILGTGSVHAGVIRGGQETSSYPAECVITVERRTVPGEAMATTIAELQQLLQQTYLDQPDLTWHVRADLERHPFHTPEDSPIMTAAMTAIAEQTGRPVRLRGEPFWTDCALLADAGIDTVLFGVRGGGAHAATEWVDLESLQQVTRALTNLTTSYCG